MLNDCLVHIDQDPVYGGGGSGFFVAPGCVITCSHVIRGADNWSRRGQRVAGEFLGQPWSGEVLFASPPQPRRGSAWEARPWQPPDIAVIRLDDPPAHSCVRLAQYQLDDEAPDDPVRGTRLHAVVGRSAFTGSLTNFPLDRIEYQGPVERLLALIGHQFKSGMSGSPVLDPRTGKVCGMLKTTLSPTECLAVPLGELYDLMPAGLAATILSAHDRFHYEDQRWIEAQEPCWDQVVEASRANPWDYPRATPLLRPAEEAELLGLVAGLTASGVSAGLELGRLYRLATADTLVQAAPDELPDLRSLIFRMQDHALAPGRLHPIVELVELLADSLQSNGEAGFARSLSDWSTHVTSRMDINLRKTLIKRRNMMSQGASPSARGDRGLRSLIIKLEPFNPAPPAQPDDFHQLASPDKFTVTVMEYWSDSNGRTVFTSDGPCTLDEAVAAMRPAADRALRDLGGPSTLVELVVPVHLFDLAADLWRLFQQPYPAPPGSGRSGREEMPLGALHPVVVRALDRFGEPWYRDYVGPWWDRIREQPGVPLTWVDCVDLPTARPRPGSTADVYQGTCLGLSGPAGQGHGYTLMDGEIAAGLPVAVWRRVPCDEHDGEPGAGVADGSRCGGDQFRAAVEQFISGTSLADLPAASMRLRNGGNAVTPDLAILWDNPRRGPLPSRLEIGGTNG